MDSPRKCTGPRRTYGSCRQRRLCLTPPPPPPPPLPPPAGRRRGLCPRRRRSRLDTCRKRQPPVQGFYPTDLSLQQPEIPKHRPGHDLEVVGGRLWARPASRKSCPTLSSPDHGDDTRTAIDYLSAPPEPSSDTVRPLGLLRAAAAHARTASLGPVDASGPSLRRRLWRRLIPRRRPCILG